MGIYTRAFIGMIKDKEKVYNFGLMGIDTMENG
jgi:hypothetical protein